jgi:NTE family protein
VAGNRSEPDLTAPQAELLPVHDIPARGREPEDGIGLCLSGGGYRAMLFHAGAIWRLNEARYLPRLRRVSSVSGGSFTAGVLGLHWHELAFDDGRATNFVERVVAPIRGIAGRTIDAPAIAAGVLLPGSVSSRIIDTLDDHLFHGATLQDLPAEPPRFVINATNLGSGVLWRFSRPYMRDYRVGEVRNPTVSLAQAVAASAAFPPFLSPVELDLSGHTFEPGSGHDLQAAPYTRRAELSDGGVYDNLGLETVFKRYRTVLVSDGGGQFDPDPDPANDWVRHMLRVLQTIDNQVRSLRKRQLIGAYRAGIREGAYWGIGSDIADYRPAPPGLLPAPHERTMVLARVATRLAKVSKELQESLINWGYAACDAALRTHVDATLEPPTGFPYPGAAV